jgi:hypothetical protein
MKKIITSVFVILLFCGCAAQKEQENNTELASEATNITETQTAIPPFVKEEREILPLPERNEASNDPTEFVDTLIDDYEVKHFDTFDTDFVLSNMEITEISDGRIFTGQDDSIYTTGSISFNQPLSEYFNAPENNYAVLIRFKSDEIDQLQVAYSGVTLSFSKGIYPAIDIYGDAYGDPMLYDNWNSYIYQPGEWAYVFMTATYFRQRSCYIWGEDDAGDYNFHTSFSEAISDAPPEFYMRLNKQGETATVSDIWLFSY